MAIGEAIVVVGVCASGKTTLTRALRRLGLNARQVLQEHSYVPDMWLRLAHPDLLIYLDADADTIRRRRRSESWPDWLRLAEVKRLRHALEHCDLYVKTDDLSPSEVEAIVVDFLS